MVKGLIDGVSCYDKICFPNQISTPSGNYWKSIDNTYYIDNETMGNKWKSADFVNYRIVGNTREAYTCIYRAFNGSGKTC